MKNVLIKYVRDQKKQPIGVVTAIANGTDIAYGWSLCNRKSGDKWDKKFGVELAMQRAVPINVLALNALENQVPRTVARDLTSMIYRAKSYFHQV